jgi:hypothetical protein
MVFAAHHRAVGRGLTRIVVTARVVERGERDVSRCARVHP